MAVNSNITQTSFTDQSNIAGTTAKVKIKKIHIDELRACINKLETYANNVDNCGNCTACQTCQSTTCQSCQACQSGCQSCQMPQCNCNCYCDGDDGGG
jgi:hypothetical protein